MKFSGSLEKLVFNQTVALLILRFMNYVVEKGRSLKYSFRQAKESENTRYWKQMLLTLNIQDVTA